MDDDIETSNRFLVSVRAGRIVILNYSALGELSRLEAVNLAAWLVAIAGEDEAFKQILQLARNT